MEDAHICADATPNVTSSHNDQRLDKNSMETNGVGNSNIRKGGKISNGNRDVSSTHPIEGDQSIGTKSQRKKDLDEQEDQEPPQEDLRLPPHHYFSFLMDTAEILLLTTAVIIFCQFCWNKMRFKITNESGGRPQPCLFFQSQKIFGIWKRKKQWNSKAEMQDKKDNLLLHRNHGNNSNKWNKTANKKSSSKKTVANQNQKCQDENLGLPSKLLQRALEDAFVKLNMVLPRSPPNMDGEDDNISNNIVDDNWGTYQELEEKDFLSTTRSSLAKSQNAQGETIPGMVAMTVLVKRD